MNLRYYQRDAIQAVLTRLQMDASCNPCVEIPTGGGKTPIIATLCRVLAEAGARVLCIAHRKELLEQTADKIKTWAPNVRFSIVSAGLNERDFSGQVVIAGIQSIYRQTEKLLNEGKIDFAIVDEAHLIPSTDENADGMYQSLLRSLRTFNPRCRVIGLTATPYRLSSGEVCGADKILTEICYKVGVAELVSNGFLSKLVSKAPPAVIDERELKMRGGEFDKRDVDEVYNVDGVIHDACRKISTLTHNRKSALIFCCGKEHAEKVAKELVNITREEVACVFGDTPSAERESILKRFKGELKSSLLGEKEKPIKYLVNVEVLTTGFDAPNVDCVCLLRPTASPGLYYQMVGRGFRLCEGKPDCLILDFASNIRRFGSVDQIEPPRKKTARELKKDEEKTKVCPVCFEVIDAKLRTCPRCGNKLTCNDFCCPGCGTMQDASNKFCSECGFSFVNERQPKHGVDADFDNPILGSAQLPKIVERIDKIDVYEHTSKRSGKTSLKVVYHTPTQEIPEFICFEHEGFARQKAEAWWSARTNIQPAPVSVRQARLLYEYGVLREPKKLEYYPKKPNDFAPKIINYLDNKDYAIERKSAPPWYPRTDNPLNLTCDKCGCESFCYEKNGDYRVITCALCGETALNFDPAAYDSRADYEGEIDALRLKYCVDFYDADKGVWFGESQDATREDVPCLDELDNLPF